MRNKILFIGGVAFLAYVLGSRASKNKGKTRESVGHQIVRLWNDPKARKSRKKSAKKLAKSSQVQAKKLAKTAESRAKVTAKAVRARANDVKKNLQ